MLNYVLAAGFRQGGRPGDDENWMKHTLSWLDKPYVEDAKVSKIREFLKGFSRK